jgi:hypothetical protein|tara:strand:- start:696 stop:1121 length:426 start_codon:yes stop_codon:yes gene_type:complete
MDKWFCFGCLQLWGQGQVMKGCIGCAAHVASGWTTEQMIEIYEPILKNSQNKRAYFPYLSYEYTPRLRTRPPNLSKVLLNRTMTILSASDCLIGFVSQQSQFLNKYEQNQTDIGWGVLHPITQKLLMNASQVKTYYKSQSN